MQPLAYLDTAYDSTRPRDLPQPISDEQRNFTAKARRRDKLDPMPVECGEYLPLTSLKEVEYLREDKSRNSLTNNLEPLTLAWATTSNPLFWVALIYGMCTFIGTVIIFLSPILLLLGIIFSPYGFVDQLQGLTPILIGGLAMFALRYLLDYLLKHDKIANRNNTVFERCSGMVHMPAGKGQVRSIPFDEFAPYVHTIISNYGNNYYHFMLAHKYSDAFAVYSASHGDTWECNLEWEFYQQFMDISKPLPDVPSLEPWRALDPTTIAWDVRMSRPADFWKNSPKGGYAKLSKEAWQAAKAFPWGATRQTAIKAGWQPSTFGKQSWWAAKPSNSHKATT